MVKNGPNDSTKIGALAVARSPRYGHTMVMLNVAIIIQTVLLINLQHRPRDSMLLVDIGGFPPALTISVNSSICSIAELATAA
jgi:hypothetical protein